MAADGSLGLSSGDLSGGERRTTSVLAISRWKWVCPIGILATDLAIGAMDQQFRLLVLGDAATDARRRRLRVCDPGHPAVARASDGPFPVVRHNVLVLAHASLPFCGTRWPLAPAGSSRRPAGYGKR